MHMKRFVREEVYVPNHELQVKRENEGRKFYLHVCLYSRLLCTI